MVVVAVESGTAVSGTAVSGTIVARRNVVPTMATVPAMHVVAWVVSVATMNVVRIA